MPSEQVNLRPAITHDTLEESRIVQSEAVVWLRYETSYL